MTSSDDPSDFIDGDFQDAKKGLQTATAGGFSPSTDRPLSPTEIETRVSEKQVELARLKRAQEELERERAGLEELRRRQREFQTGREEMLQSLTRGIGLLEEAELTSRREAEQMAKTLAEFRDALDKVQILNEQNFGRENYTVELTRALTTIENARMEWNTARLKFAVLNGEPRAPGGPASNPAAIPLAGLDLGQLFKLGLALTWPVVVLGLGIFLILLLRH
jgi:hypothetical protein